MKIIVDAFGGDNAPLAIVKGSVEAKQEYGCDILLVGDEAAIRDCASQNNLDLTGMEFKQAGVEIPVEADPRQIAKEYKDSSMAVGLQALAAGEGDAFVSAGSTGALMVGSSHIVRRIKGVRSAALTVIAPSDNGPYLLLDVGANINCTPETLNVFAIMGKIYMEKVHGIKEPRVGLGNIGTEPNKGTELQVAAYKMMEQNDNYNFIGNVEFRDIPMGAADVVVCDGYTGNVFLKTMEGTAIMLFKNIKEMLMKSTKTKLAALALKSSLKELKTKFDFNAYGGAPLMGISKPVIKAHGSSKDTAFKNAIRQAMDYADSGVIDAIAEAVPQRGEDKPEEDENA